jgi:hypothetical protein
MLKGQAHRQETDKLNPPGRKRKYVSVEKKYAAITNPLRKKLNGE